MSPNKEEMLISAGTSSFVLTIVPSKLAYGRSFTALTVMPMSLTTENSPSVAQNWIVSVPDSSGCGTALSRLAWSRDGLVKPVSDATVNVSPLSTS